MIFFSHFVFKKKFPNCSLCTPEGKKGDCEATLLLLCLLILCLLVLHVLPRLRVLPRLHVLLLLCYQIDHSTVFTQSGICPFHIIVFELL